MKKGIIASAVVMVLAFISTVCFGVACGRQGLQAIFRDDGLADEWREVLTSWRDAELYGNVDDWDDDHRMQVLQGDGTAGTEIELEQIDTLHIDAECGNVRILKCTDGDTVKAVLEQYSKRAGAEPQYGLSASENGELRLTGRPNGDGVTAILSVYVPSDLQMLSVHLDVGELDIVGITAENMEAELSTGDLKMENCTVTNANIRVQTGSAEIETHTVFENLKLECSCGNAEVEIPEAVPFRLEYEVKTGAVEGLYNKPYDVERTNVQSTTGDKGSLRRTSNGGETEALYNVTVHLGNFEISFAPDFDD